MFRTAASEPRVEKAGSAATGIIVGFVDDVAKAVEVPVDPPRRVAIDHIPHAAKMIREGPKRLVVDRRHEAFDVFLRHHLATGYRSSQN